MLKPDKSKNNHKMQIINICSLVHVCEQKISKTKATILLLLLDLSAVKKIRYSFCLTSWHLELLYCLKSKNKYSYFQNFIFDFWSKCYFNLVLYLCPFFMREKGGNLDNNNRYINQFNWLWLLFDLNHSINPSTNVI